ncbi:MAG: hypothetical protein QM737_04645 [Ferruginibacter sp.]
MSRFTRYIFIVGLFSLASIINPMRSYGQVQPTDPGCDPLDPACPIDDGVTLLIVAGIGLAAINAYKLKKTTAKI